MFPASTVSVNYNPRKLKPECLDQAQDSHNAIVRSRKITCDIAIIPIRVDGDRNNGLGKVRLYGHYGSLLTYYMSSVL